MIAQILFTLVLVAVVLVAFVQLARIPLVGTVTILVALFGAYVVWVPDHATYLANAIGIGRGADLILYVWVLIGSAVLLLLYLNLRQQFQLITRLARTMALSGAREPSAEARKPLEPV